MRDWEQEAQENNDPLVFSDDEPTEDTDYNYYTDEDEERSSYSTAEEEEPH